MAFNNDISFIGGQYFAVENVSAYQNGSIVSDSDNSAIKLDFLFPYPRTATEYKIFPPNEPNIYDASYMQNVGVYMGAIPNQLCYPIIYRSQWILYWIVAKRPIPGDLKRASPIYSLKNMSLLIQGYIGNII